MDNIKWGLIAAAAAAVISAGLGIVSGVGVFYIVTRSLIFAAVFLGLGFTLRFLINRFLPELLLANDEGQESFDIPGSRVNITLDSTGEYAVPQLYKTPDNPDELGNIEDLVSGAFKPRTGSDGSYDAGIDRMKEESYNTGGNTENSPDYEGFSFQEEGVVEKTPAEKPAFTPGFGEEASLGDLPDFDSMARAFSTGESAQGSGASPVQDDDPSRPKYVGSKPQALEGNFSPKDLAKGISTILSKEK